MVTLQDQLRALSNNIVSERTLSGQIGDLREVRATIRERLQATETSLVDARQEVAALRLRDQEQSGKIVALETVVAKAQTQPAEAPQSLLRIQELDSRNKDLQSDIATMKKEAEDLSSQLQQTSTEVRNVTDRLAEAQSKFEATRREVMRLEEEKSTSERQASLEQEQMRKELSKAANMELSSERSKHMNDVQHLKLEKSATEERLKSVTIQVNVLKSEKARSEKENNQLQAQAKAAQNDKEAVIGVRKALQLHLKEMEARMLEKNKEYAELQARLNLAKNQSEAKDVEIKALQASLAVRPKSSRSFEQINNLRSAQPNGDGQGLHRDSQRASFTQSPSVRPTSSRSSRYFPKRKSVVEDSQPSQKPSFVSLDDIMLEDPFAGYAQEPPQLIAGEEISHLFPSTPGAGTQAKDLDYTCKSVVQTTVVSETQRRQQHSFRGATPHIGTHATDQHPSQSLARTQTIPVHMDTRPRSSAASSPIKPNSSRPGPNNLSSHREASIKHESTQSQGNSKEQRQAKRNAVAAGLGDASSQTQASKVPRANHTQQAKAVGPVIADSQSPLLKGRSRKMTKRNPSAPKGEAPLQGL